MSAGPRHLTRWNLNEAANSGLERVFVEDIEKTEEVEKHSDLASVFVVPSHFGDAMGWH
jgi:hypothetical protein